MNLFMLYMYAHIYFLIIIIFGCLASVVALCVVIVAHCPPIAAAWQHATYNVMGINAYGVLDGMLHTVHPTIPSALLPKKYK